MKDEFEDKNGVLKLNDDSEQLSEENILDTIRKLRAFLIENPDKEIRIVKNIDNENNYYGDIERIKEEFKKDDVLSHSKNVKLLMPSTSSPNNIVNSFGDVIVNCSFYSMEVISDADSILDTISLSIENTYNTPFERLMAAYMICVNYKDYLDSSIQKESRSLYSILFNNFIVCEGYCNLLNELLSRLGIKSTKYIYRIKKGKNHAVNVIEINDDVYDINGVFIFDPTLDNYKKRHNDIFDYYNSSVISFGMSSEMFENTHDKLLDDMLLVDTGRSFIKEEDDLYDIVSENSIPNDKIIQCLRKIYKNIFGKSFDENEFNKFCEFILNNRLEDAKPSLQW